MKESVPLHIAEIWRKSSQTCTPQNRAEETTACDFNGKKCSRKDRGFTPPRRSTFKDGGFFCRTTWAPGHATVCAFAHIWTTEISSFNDYLEIYEYSFCGSSQSLPVQPLLRDMRSSLIICYYIFHWISMISCPRICRQHFSLDLDQSWEIGTIVCTTWCAFVM